MANSSFSTFSFHLQRRVHNIHLRAIISACYKIILPKPTVFKENNYLKIGSSEQEIFQNLKKDGFSDLGELLSADQIENIKNGLKNLKCYGRIGNTIEEIDLEKPNENFQLANFRREDLITIPEVVSFANDSKILNVVSSYLGVKPTISNINCWWSFGDRQSAKEAQFFHRDVDDIKFLKMFVYLTDVTSENGPHVFVKKSHKSNELIQLRRFSDKEVFSKFDEKDILTLEKQKGNCFIEDTYGIHKGQLPLTGNRLILQVQYSYLPLYVEKYSPKKSNLLDKMNLDKYTNRLLFKNA